MTWSAHMEMSVWIFCTVGDAATPSTVRYSSLDRDVQTKCWLLTIPDSPKGAVIVLVNKTILAFRLSGLDEGEVGI